MLKNDNDDNSKKKITALQLPLPTLIIGFTESVLPERTMLRAFYSIAPLTSAYSSVPYVSVNFRISHLRISLVPHFI